MSKKMSLILASLTLVSGLILYFIPLQLAPVCQRMPDKPPMACFWGSQACQGLALCAIALGLVLLVLSFVKECKSSFQAGLGTANLLLGAIVYVVLVRFIGGCKNPEMGCRLHTLPAYVMMALVFVLLGLVYLFQGLKSASKK